MTKLEYLFRRIRKCDLMLNSLLFDHGENEDLKGAVDHSASLVWHLERLVKPTGCEEGGSEPAPETFENGSE